MLGGMRISLYTFSTIAFLVLAPMLLTACPHKLAITPAAGAAP